MKTLADILRTEGWGGECGFGTDKGTTHNYIDGFYEKEFIGYRDKSVKILEIGIASGHSLLLWDKYFTNHSGIYGLENCAEGKVITEDLKKNDRITLIIADGYCKKTADILPNFDIIIDDGPHTLDSMITCINLYLPKLNDGGVLIIEDVQSTDWISHLHTAATRVFKDEMSSDVFDISVVDLRQTKGRYDDLMFIIRKKTQDTGVISE
jgi:hypothetical protein